MLIQKGYSLRNTNEERNNFIDVVEFTMNGCILGSQFNETNWKIPLNDTKTDVLVSAFSFTDMQSKKISAHIQLLLHDVFDDSIENWEELFNQWNNVIQSFLVINSFLTSRVMFDDQMIQDLRVACDSFFQSWVTLNGLQGMTNYLHITGSHLPEFAEKYRNFYMYLQQGWEHANKKAGTCYHRHNQKGGHGAKDEERSHILPIFRFMARVWMWVTTHAVTYFNNKNKS